MQLHAEAFSVRPGALVEKFSVGDSLVMHGGKVLAVDIKGQVLVHGERSDTV